MRVTFILAAAISALWGCAGDPPGLPDLAHQTADRYLEAWQNSDWNKIYALEERSPEQGSLFHDALTDQLEYYLIDEVRFSDSAVACAVTLRWRTAAGSYAEAGELYLERSGVDWRIRGFRGF